MKNKTPFPIDLDAQQIEVLTGLLLGDATLVRSKPTHNALLSIDRSTKDIAYLLWNKQIFNNICTESRSINYSVCGAPQNPQNKIYSTGAFSTRSCPLLNIFREKWYPNGLKIIPNDLMLTPLIVAIWFCDDGYARLRGKKKNVLHLRFCTEGFSKEDNVLLAKLLSDFCGEKVLSTPLTKEAKMWRLTASHKAAAAIVQKIDTYIPECMKRKAVWRGVSLDNKPNPNRKNRISLSKNDEIALNHSILIGPKTINDLASSINETFEANNMPIMTSQYSIKYISRLYKYGILDRKKQIMNMVAKYISILRIKRKVSYE